MSEHHSPLQEDEEVDRDDINCLMVFTTRKAFFLRDSSSSTMRYLIISSLLLTDVAQIGLFESESSGYQMSS